MVELALYSVCAKPLIDSFQSLILVRELFATSYTKSDPEGLTLGEERNTEEYSDPFGRVG